MSHQGSIAPRVATVTVSDTRTAADDRSGDALVARVLAASWEHLGHTIVPDDPAAIQSAIRDAIARGADAVLLSGGTGIAPRDQTYEAVTAMLVKTLDGFGEAFRRLSWDEIGPRAILSRAVAGTVDRAVVVALPGSTGAVALGMDRLVVPTLGHMVALLR